MKPLILHLLKQKNLTPAIINRAKRKFAGRTRLPLPPTADILKEYRRLLTLKKIRRRLDLEKILRKRPVRTLSGVAVVTVLTKPWPCPGQCVYCPSQKEMPKSYLKNEPAAQRAYLTKFDPYRQVASRLKMLSDNGHPIDKIELIVKGGSWSAYPWKFRAWFISECFRAANACHPERSSAGWRGEVEGYLQRLERDFSTPLRSAQNDNLKQLADEQKKNETAGHRIIGLTLENRPDLIAPDEVRKMRLLGCTRVELGVQHTDDEILRKIKRGHSLEDARKAAALLRNAGFKVDFHLMPQLPGSTPGKDYEMFKKIFADPGLRPDMIKIYPCAVVKSSELYRWHRQKKYQPYSNKKLAELLIKVKSQIIPPYCRISRLIRDIPSTEIIAGNKITNLREVIQAEMKKRNLRCRCLRCREIGHRQNSRLTAYRLRLFIDKYQTTGGAEYFLSYEGKKREAVFAFLRLRLPAVIARPKAETIPLGSPRAAFCGARDDFYAIFPQLRGAAFIRELHTYGQLVGISKDEKNASQHKGLGKKLMAEAEKIARKNGCKKIAVIAGVGAREYYRRLNYRLENGYMVKKIRSV